MRRTPRRLIGTFIAVAALLAVIPATASANLSLTGSHAEPADLAAGAHSPFKVHVAFGSEDVKDLTISLPPGEVGNPQATPLCDPSALPTCPANTEVGTVTTSVTIQGLLPQTLNGTVFNLVPQPGEPARFGIVINALPVSLPAPLNGLFLPPTVIQSGAALRQNDFGLDTVVQKIPNSADLINIPPLPPVPIGIHINSMDLTLDGTAPGPPPSHFMRNPTSCTAHTVGFAGDSYSSATVVTADSPSFTPTNCAGLDFSPTLSASVGGPGQTSVGSLTTATTSINQDVDEAGLIKATVLVPSDLAPNVNLLGFRCAPANFLAGTCPTTSIVGTAVAASPLLSQPLVGNVLLVDNGGLLPDIGLDLQGQLHLLLRGALNADKSVVFNGLPDIPIARFQLAFSNPPGLLQVSRDLCAPPQPLFHADFTGYNGAQTSVDAPATVNGCGAGNNLSKCKKHKVKKKHKKRAAESKKKHKKKRSCKKKKRHKKHRK